MWCMLAPRPSIFNLHRPSVKPFGLKLKCAPVWQLIALATNVEHIHMEAGSCFHAQHEADVQESAWSAKAIDSLRRNGFCVLRNALMQVELCSHLNLTVQTRLAKLLTLAIECGHDPRNARDSFMFKEVCKRMHSRRFDVRLPVARHEVCYLASYRTLRMFYKRKPCLFYLDN